MYYPIGWHRVLNLDHDSSDSNRADILAVQANQERELIFILTTKSIHIWFSRPAIEIVCHRRSLDSISRIGLNKTAVWKTDSSIIVVATEKDQLLFYQLRKRTSPAGSTRFLLNNNDDDGIYRVHYDTKNFKQSISRELPPSATDSAEHVPALTIYSFGKLDLSSIGVACLVSAEEELIVGAKNGDIYGVHWDGNVDARFPWTLDGQSVGNCDHVIDVKISSILGGFTLVFSSGRVAFMPLKPSHNKLAKAQENGRSQPLKHNRSTVNFLDGINDSTCVEINHKYRLVAFGSKSSRVVVCNMDDTKSSLVVNHILDLKNCKIPLELSRLGSVKCMRYSPDGLALVISWEDENFALWSVFGSLLFYSKQWSLDSQSKSLIRPIRVSSFAWGREGYELWMSVDLDIEDKPPEPRNETFPNNKKPVDSLEHNGTNSGSNQEIVILPLAHSNLSSSPHSSCSTDTILLMAEDRIFIGPSNPQEDKFDHWIVVDIPIAYLKSNYPIRYATVDRISKNLAIAGHKGLALYSIDQRSWKFLKKSQEDSFSVCGDLVWWRNYLLASCFNLDSESFELRAYSTDEDLDNSHLVYQWIPMEIIRMSIFENRLLVMYSDGTLGMLMLNIRRRPKVPTKSRSNLSRSNSIVSASGKAGLANGFNKEESPRLSRSDSISSWSSTPRGYALFQETVLQICPIENLIISNLQANAFCISSIALTRLHFKNNRTDDSILVNACGKLFLLEREEPPNMSSTVPTSAPPSSDLKELATSNHTSNELDFKINYAKQLSNTMHLTSASLKHKDESSDQTNVTFKTVSVIATNVEQFWISPETSNAPEMSYFKQSLWLFCGGSDNYLQIWLPLLNDKNDPPADLYVPDRIMLRIRCDIYPLAVRSSSSAFNMFEPDDAIVLGAESDTLYRDCALFTHFPYSTVKRQCRVYLHRILRELLLNQHLGYYARKIAEKCQPLPYFAHCFELLLYEVLEDEATSPVPLPDPMLPQVVRFIKEFPVYLETVVHCARKSELSMWSYLFDEKAVGSPRRLYQECLDKRKLDTAASCLIILQSLDRNVITHKMVDELLKAAKENPKFSYLVNDLERFLSRTELDSACSSGSGTPSN